MQYLGIFGNFCFQISFASTNITKVLQINYTLFFPKCSNDDLFLFFSQFDKYLLDVYYIPGMLLGAECSLLKRHTGLSSLETYFSD